MAILVHVDCPLCGAVMASGLVAVRGAIPLTAWDVHLEWEPDEARTVKRRWRDIGRRAVVPLLSGRLLGRNERRASLCHDCGAVVMDSTRRRDAPRAKG
jgi:hypothetical protein